jgi:hypothetical protein
MSLSRLVLPAEGPATAVLFGFPRFRGEFPLHCSSAGSAFQQIVETNGALPGYDIET